MAQKHCGSELKTSFKRAEGNKMAKITGRATVEMTLSFTVTEPEARALDALAGYGDDAFIKHFYEKLGKAYMRDHEQGLRAFLKSIRSEVAPILSRATLAREAFHKTRTSVRADVA